MPETLFGVETQYSVVGLRGRKPMNHAEVLQRVMDAARHELTHIPDIQSSGLYTRNSQRIMVDCSHVEISTCECSTPTDLVMQLQAADATLARLASSAESACPPGTEIAVFRCNVDYHPGNTVTFGCHDNHLHRRAQDTLRPQLIPHFCTRIIFSGSGGFNPLSRGLEFTLSPRLLAFFQQEDASSSTSERGLWHTKGEMEPLCGGGYKRLHVLCSESLCSATANYLRLSSTALIIALAEAGLNPGDAVQLANPIATLQTVATDLTCKKPLHMASGKSMTAIGIQRHYLEAAEGQIGKDILPSWAAEACALWRNVLDRLEDAPESVADCLDWGIKYALFSSHARKRGLRWEQFPLLNQVIDQAAATLATGTGPSTPMSLRRAFSLKQSMPAQVASLGSLLSAHGLDWKNVRKLLRTRSEFCELDWRFGQLGPKGTFHALDAGGVLNHRIPGTEHLERAITEPPASGRAQVRGKVIQRLAGKINVRCDWESIVDFDAGKVLDLSADPFMNEEGEWLDLERADPVNVQMERRMIFDRRLGFGFGRDSRPSSHLRREDALRRVLAGDFAGAETILRELIDERFMLPGTFCHMARVQLMTGREPEARQSIDLAWQVRDQADAYVVLRMLFFRCAFAMLDGIDLANIVGLLRSALSEHFSTMDWTVHPMLESLRSRLGETNYEFLSALAKVLSGTEQASTLDRYPQWRSRAA